MTQTTYRNRRAVQIETNRLRLTVLVEGGHIAEILHKDSGVNPLWTPPWPSIEHSTYDLAKHPEYGADSESKLLAGIMGHNLCLDFFGPPSPEEAEAGLTVHGEASVVPYEITAGASELVACADLPIAQLRLERGIQLAPDGGVVRFTETVENVSAADRPVAWTEHITLGPPFLEKGSTQFRAPGTRSKVYEIDFSEDKGYMKIGAQFDWPHVPHKERGSVDLRVYTNAPVSGGFTTHLMDPHREQAFFMAFSPKSKVLCGYVWKRLDFPWLGIWEENYSRLDPPWNGKTLTRGMEFGASPMAETRREMIDRGRLFGTPCYRWIPAKSRVRVDYCAFLTTAAEIPEAVSWDGGDSVKFS
jgi:hypothetical protein